MAEKLIFVLMGFVLGLCATSAIAIRTIQEQMKWLKNYNEFFTKYAKLSDEQLKAIETDFDERIEKIKSVVKNLLDIDISITKNNSEFQKSVLELVERDHRNNSALVTELRKLVESSNMVNDERWNLICDYITNKGPTYEPTDYNILKED